MHALALAPAVAPRATCPPSRLPPFDRSHMVCRPAVTSIMSCLEPLEQIAVCAVARLPISACRCRPPPAVATARRAWGDGERARCALLAPCCASRISPCISCPRWYDDPLLEGVFSSVPACASRPDLGPFRVPGDQCRGRSLSGDTALRIQSA